MKIGYAQAYTNDQDNSLQISSLKAAGAEKIYKDKASDSKLNRVEFKKMLSKLNEGDILIVWKLDRVARSTLQLLTIMEQLHSKKIDFKSINEAIDTSTNAGRMMMKMIVAIADFERTKFNERTKKGQAEAKIKGVKFGPKKKLTPEQEKEITQSIDSGEKTAVYYSRLLKISEATISRLMKAHHTRNIFVNKM